MDVGRGGKPFEPFEPLRASPENFGRDWKAPSLRSPACASFGSVFNIKAVAALCRLARGAILGGPWGAVLGGAPLMADISVYARLRGMRPNLRPATYWKLWTSVGGESLLSLLSLLSL